MIAYYLGFHYPSPRSGDPATAQLSIERVQFEHEPLLTVELTEAFKWSERERAHRALVAKMLEDYTGEPADPERVEAFIVDRPGKSWARVTPADLDDFCGQRELLL